MIAPAATALETEPGAPDVWMLDARATGLDELGLRSWARQLPQAVRAAYSSRSYRHPYALVACGSEPLGVDLERVEPFDQVFLQSICTAEERKRRLSCDGSAIASLWCSKEALSKALGDALAYDPRRLGSPIFWPGGTSGPWRAVSLPVPGGYVGWLCWRSARNQN